MSIELYQKPPIFGRGDYYSLDTLSGTMAAGLAAAAPVYSIRWTSLTHEALIRRISVAMSSLGTAFTAGVGKFEVVAARSFSASDSGGSSILPATDKQKLRTAFATTRFGDMRQSTTATLTAGTRTLDTNPLRQVFFAIGTATNTVYLPTVIVFGALVDADHPLILVKDEGFIIRATVPATGTWQFNVALEWIELSIN
jgi:hypothetical protein